MTPAPSSDASSEDDSSPGDSRRDRLATRRRRRVRIGIAVAVGALVCGAAGAYAAVNGDTDRPALAVGSGDPNATTTQPGPPGAVVGTSPIAAVRPVDHAHPLRLWVGGDSLAGSFGPALGDAVGATGVARAVVDFKVSSGLWSNDVRNWDARATEQMATDPDAVVFIIGTNDTVMVNNVDANGDGVADWVPGYRAKVDRMMDLLVGAHHRPVIWLGAPRLGTESMDEGAAAVDKVMQEEAAKRGPDVTYVDTYKLFSSPTGAYSRRIVDDTGKEILARIADGVHFTPDGADYLARIVYKVLDERWRLTKQADPANPIGWTWAPGSIDTVPGYSSTPRSRYRSSSGSGSSSHRHSGSGSQSNTTYASPGPLIETPTSVFVAPTPTTTHVETPTIPKAPDPSPTTAKP